MAISRKIGFLLARATLRSLGVRPMPAVFIMGHMRCGSTLLLHILLSNRECIGCGERNAEYRSTEDLDKLEIASRIAQRAPFRRGHAIDQINHDRFTPNAELLHDERVRCIFLIRDPQATVQSILNLTQTFYKAWTVERAVDYYVERLEKLAAHAEGVRRERETLALTYDSLVHDSAKALRLLEGFLGLSGELGERYTIQRFTGKRGDPSENIRVGRIMRERVDRPVEIPTGELDRAWDAYRACAQTLKLDGTVR